MQDLAVVQVGMLGVRGTPLPSAPMAHLVGADLSALWFLAEADTDLVRAWKVARRLGTARRAALMIVTPVSAGRYGRAGSAGSGTCLVDHRRSDVSRRSG